jgi:tRNA G10  N-methylase Trm11
MIREYLKQIEDGVEVRKNLIALKAACKDSAGRTALLYALNNQLDLFYDLLKSEEPKVRKNVALILGQLGVQEALTKLYDAYEKEGTMFVKSSYLTAMRELDYRQYLEAFKKRLQELQSQEIEESNRKHIKEECKLLQDMILALEGYQKHTFTGWKVPSRIILMTNRNFKEVTAEQIKSHRPKVFNAGVQARTSDLREILEVRTFKELLFVLEDKSSLEKRGETIDEIACMLAKQMLDSSLLTFLKERHEGEGPFYFRIECKNKMDLKQKSTFTKKLGEYLQEKSGNQLINSTSRYEVELRLVQNKTGNFNFLIKLFTLKDERFAYRKEALSSSIQPVNAALVMQLTKDYLTENAQVLDPFCGVGTMLIERNRFLPTGDMYGIDLFGKGIEAARRNTELAGLRINYINRDFFDFKHAYLFDEVISNMPRAIGQKTKTDITLLYKKFWTKIKEHIGKGSILVLYCYDREILKATIPTQFFTIKEEFEISKKEDAYCYVISYGKN